MIAHLFPPGLAIRIIRDYHTVRIIQDDDDIEFCENRVVIFPAAAAGTLWIGKAKRAGLGLAWLRHLGIRRIVVKSGIPMLGVGRGYVLVGAVVAMSQAGGDWGDWGGGLV